MQYASLFVGVDTGEGFHETTLGEPGKDRGCIWFDGWENQVGQKPNRRDNLH